MLLIPGRSSMVEMEDEVVKGVGEEEEEEGEVFEVRKSGSPVRDPAAAWMGFMSFPRQRPPARATPSWTSVAGDIHIRYAFRNKTPS